MKKIMIALVIVVLTAISGILASAEYTIAIDPGYTGCKVDSSEKVPIGPGASEQVSMYPESCVGGIGKLTGIKEADINLGVGLELRDCLKDMGYNVILLRENNNTPTSSKGRAMEASVSGADIFIRLYCRKDQSISERGAMVYLPSDKNPYIGYMYDECNLLGNLILEHYCSKTEFENSGIKYTDKTVGINWSEIPVAQVMLGCISDSKDEIRLSNEENWKTMAEGIAYAIDVYFAMTEEVSDEIENQVQIDENWALYHEYFQQETFHTDMKLYYQYVEKHELNDYIKNIYDEYTTEEMLAQKIEVADFDQDERVEIWISGYGAEANTQSAILDIINGEVYCAFSGWGTRMGQYKDPATGEQGLVIMEGNVSYDDFGFYSSLGLYDEDWYRLGLCEGYRSDDEVSYYYDKEGDEITQEAYDRLWKKIRDNCTDTNIIFEREQMNMDTREVLNILYLVEQGEA